MNESMLKSQPKLEMAWLQVRMCWQSVKKTRLDQEKKDVIAALVRHYRETGHPDRLCFEFEQVLLRLEEEHELRLKELGRETRRVAKQVNNIIQVIRDTNEARMQQCRDKVEETPAIITEWKGVMELLFSQPGAKTFVNQVPATPPRQLIFGQNSGDSNPTAGKQPDRA